MNIQSRGTKLILALLALILAAPAMAWKGNTHNWLTQEGYDVIRAMGEHEVADYLDDYYGSASTARYYAGFYGKDEDNPQGGGTSNLDNDIWFDAWWTYSRNGSPDLFGLVDVSYFVALSHFVDTLRGGLLYADHGQNPPGYTYDRSRYLHDLSGDSWTGDYDGIARAYSYNTNPTSGTRSRMDALCGGSCNFSKSKFDDDFQDTHHVSAPSAAQALVDKFIATGNVKYLFRAMHYVEDAAQPHHAGLYYGKDHTDLEGYAQDNYYNSAKQIRLTDDNLAYTVAWADYYADYFTAESTVKSASDWSSYTCTGVYVNDYTSVQDDCLENVMPRIRAAVAGIIVRAVKQRIN